MKLVRFRIPLLLAAFILFGTSAALSAEKEATDQKKDPWPWRFNANIYGWLPRAPADVTIGGIEKDLPEDFGTLLSDFVFAAEFEIEVHKGPIGVFVSPIFARLKDSKNVQGPFESREVTVEEKAWIVDYGASYAFGPWDSVKGSKLTLEPYAAGRYLHDKIRISVSPGSTHDRTIEFNTPVIGLRAHWDFDNPWFLSIVGDYGGFGGVGDVNNTWQAVGKVGYAFNIKGVTTNAFLGFRYLHIDYSKDLLGINLDIYGPFLGIGVEF
jgi:hypothetical protein